MANFLAELKWRSIFRIGAVYAVVAWILLQLVNNLTPALNALLWHSSYTPVRKTERLKAYASKSALVDYWRAKGCQISVAHRGQRTSYAIEAAR
jgi:hypothetical protein